MIKLSNYRNGIIDIYFRGITMLKLKEENQRRVIAYLYNNIQKGITEMKAVKLLMLILIMLTFSLTGYAQQESSSNESENEKTYEEMAFNFSVFYPLSLNKNDEVTTNLNLSMFYGKVGSVNGVEMSGLVNHVKRDVVGCDFAGIANIIGTDLTGFQGAGIFNYVGSNASYFQTAGIANYVGGNFSGFQVAGIANVLRGELNGLQASVVNIAGDVNGVQIGVANLGSTMKGLQIGVINIADKMEGVPIGLINYAKQGKVHAVVWGSNIMLTNVGVKFAVNDYFYSILSAGYNNNSKNVTKSLAVGCFSGLHFPLDDGLYLETDLGIYRIDNDKIFNSKEGIINQSMLQVRLMAGYTITNTFSIFAGCGNNYSLDDNQKFLDGKNEIMFMAGLQLF